jgi:hypothetical protein
MRKCEYCGHENGDEAVRCLGCGTEFLVPTAQLRRFDFPPLHIKRHWLMVCGVYPPGFVRRAPVFAIASISAPLVGFLVARVANSLTDFGGGDMRGLAALCQLIEIMLLALALGGISALTALLRGEKWRALSFLGLVLDFGPVLYLLFTWIR